MDTLSPIYASTATPARTKPRRTSAMAKMTCIEDLRRAAQRQVPRAFFGYAEAGSYSEQTLRANLSDLQSVLLRQRVLVDISRRSTSTTMLGEPVALPIALAPIGIGGLQRGDGEILACRAAQAAGVPYTLGTLSICSIEDVAAAVEKPFWFQLYVMKDRGFARSLVERAIAAKCSALVLTVDLQVLGQRHADIKNGLSVPPAIKLANLINMATKPRWAYSVLTGKRRTFGNLAGHVKGEARVKALTEWVAHQFDETLSWKDVEWIRSIWPGKLIIKGILDVEDAVLRPRPARPRSSSPTTAAVSWTARHRRSRPCRGLPMPSARTSRSCSMAAFDPGRTSCARSPLAHGAALSAAPTSTASAPEDKPASHGPSRSSKRSSTSPWASPA